MTRPFGKQDFASEADRTPYDQNVIGNWRKHAELFGQHAEPPMIPHIDPKRRRMHVREQVVREKVVPENVVR